MKRTTRKPWRNRMRSVPKALLCMALALTLSVAPAGPALAQAQRLEAPVRTASAQAASGVVVKGDGVTIDGTFISKDAFLDAVSHAKRVAYPQGEPAEPASLRSSLAPSARPALFAPSDGRPGAALPAPCDWDLSGAEVAIKTAVVEYPGILGAWTAAMDRVTYLASAAFAKNTAWLVAVEGMALRFAFTDTGQLLLLLADGTVCSIAPCWLSIAVVQYAADHAGDPIEGEGESGAAGALTTEAIKKAVTDVQPAQKEHILQDKHNWNKLVPDPKDPENWDKIAAIISQVLANGKEGPYKEVYERSLEVGGEMVTVVFNTVDGVVKLGDAWIR